MPMISPKVSYYFQSCLSFVYSEIKENLRNVAGRDACKCLIYFLILNFSLLFLLHKCYFFLSR